VNHQEGKERGNKDERGDDATSPALEHSLLQEKLVEKKIDEED